MRTPCVKNLKSLAAQAACRFDSGPRHQLNQAVTAPCAPKTKHQKTKQSDSGPTSLRLVRFGLRAPTRARFFCRVGKPFRLCGGLDGLHHQRHHRQTVMLDRALRVEKIGTGRDGVWRLRIAYALLDNGKALVMERRHHLGRTADREALCVVERGALVAAIGDHHGSVISDHLVVALAAGVRGLVANSTGGRCHAAKENKVFHAARPVQQRVFRDKRLFRNATLDLKACSVCIETPPENKGGIK